MTDKGRSGSANDMQPYGEQEPGVGGAHPGPVGDHGEPDHREKGSWTPPGRSMMLTILIIVLIVIALLVILAAWRLPPFTSGGPRTDNAYVRGTTTVIAPQVSGTISTVTVKDYGHVRAGQLLVLVDDSSYRAKAMQARASVEQAQAQLSNNRQQLASAKAALEGKLAALGSAQAQYVNASAQLARDNDLVTDGSVSHRERDQAEADHRQALAGVRQARADVDIARENVRSVEVQRDGLEASVAQARAQLYAADVDLGRTRIYAPSDGQLGEVRVRVGAYVATGTQLFSIVPPARWIIADYKEDQTRDMRVGQRATFRVDALGGRRFYGFVERIAPATGSEFSVMKPDNATGNFVKVPQRIGVKIAIPVNQAYAERLRPGMSVETWIDTVPGDGAVDRPR